MQSKHSCNGLMTVNKIKGLIISVEDNKSILV